MRKRNNNKIKNEENENIMNVDSDMCGEEENENSDCGCIND
jgi:hypothetical protein